MVLLKMSLSKTAGGADIRAHIREVERSQREARRDLDVLGQTKEQRVREAVAAKKAGKQELLSDIFREVTQV